MYKTEFAELVSSLLIRFILVFSLTGHGAELAYVFHTLEKYYTEEEKALANVASRYWGNFVNTGDPNNDPNRAPEFNVGTCVRQKDKCMDTVSTCMLASSPGHSQILSRSHGEKLGEGLGSKTTSPCYVLIESTISGP